MDAPAKMRVIAVKLTEDPASTKVLYEKAGKKYIRTGDDGFKVGKPLQAPLSAVMNKWGFNPVEVAPEFRDSDELIDSLPNFSLNGDGTVSYKG